MSALARMDKAEALKEALKAATSSSSAKSSTSKEVLRGRGVRQQTGTSLALALHADLGAELKVTKESSLRERRMALNPSSGLSLGLSVLATKGFDLEYRYFFQAVMKGMEFNEDGREASLREIVSETCMQIVDLKGGFDASRSVFIIFTVHSLLAERGCRLSKKDVLILVMDQLPVIKVGDYAKFRNKGSFKMGQKMDPHAKLRFSAFEAEIGANLKKLSRAFEEADEIHSKKKE